MGNCKANCARSCNEVCSSELSFDNKSVDIQNNNQKASQSKTEAYSSYYQDSKRWKFVQLVQYRTSVKLKLNIKSGKFDKQTLQTSIVTYGTKIIQIEPNEFIITGGLKSEKRFTWFQNEKIVEYEMLFPRVFHGISHDRKEQKLYIFSGFIDTIQEFQYKCEVYDINSDIFKKLCDIPQPAQNFGQGQLGNQIYVFGGEYNDSYLNIIQIYNIQKDLWSLCSNQLANESEVCCIQLNSPSFNNQLLIFNLSDNDFLDGTYLFNGAEFKKISIKYQGDEIYTLPVEIDEAIYIFDEYNFYIFDLKKYSWDIVCNVEEKFSLNGSQQNDFISTNRSKQNSWNGII